MHFPESSWQKQQEKQLQMAAQMNDIIH